MRMMKYFVILFALVSLCNADSVQYDIDYGDSIGTNVTYKGANTGLFLLGWTSNRMRYVIFSNEVMGVIGDVYVSRPAPNWAGPAVSNLNLGGHIITNVSSIFISNILLNSSLGVIEENGGIFSLGNSSAGSYRNILYNNKGAGILGCLDSVSMATIDTNSKGSIIVGYLNNANDYIRGRGSDIIGYRDRYDSKIIGNGSFLAISARDGSLSSNNVLAILGDGILMGGLFDQYYGQFTNYGNGSFGWGRNVRITNTYAAVFGDGTSSMLNNNVHAPWVYLSEIPWHTNHAVPMWWVKLNWTNSVADDRYVNRYTPNWAGAAVSNLNMGLRNIYNITNITTSISTNSLNTTILSENISELVGNSPDSADTDYFANKNIVKTKSKIVSYNYEIQENLALYEIQAIAEDVEEGAELTNSAIISLNPMVIGTPIITTRQYITVNTNFIRHVKDPIEGLDAVNLRTLTNSITNAIVSLPDVYVNRRTLNFVGPAISNLSMGFKNIYNPSNIIITYSLFENTNVHTRTAHNSLVATMSGVEAMMQPLPGLYAINRLSSAVYGTNVSELSAVLELSAIANEKGVDVTRLVKTAIISLNPMLQGDGGYAVQESYVTVNTNLIKYVKDPAEQLDAVNLRTLTNKLDIMSPKLATLQELRQGVDPMKFVGASNLFHVVDMRYGTNATLEGPLGTYPVGTGGYINISGGNAIKVDAWPIGTFFAGDGGRIDLKGGDSYITATISHHGGNGGSIISRGGIGGKGGNINLSSSTELGISLGAGNGGNIIATGVFMSSAGSLNMSAGLLGEELKNGGSIDTTLGMLQLGAYISGGDSKDGTIIRKLPTNSRGTLYLPPMDIIPGKVSTVMTTRAFSNLDMANNEVKALKPLPMPTEAAFSGVMSNAVGYAQITNLLYLMSLQTTPIGSIQAYPGAIGSPPPDGWLYCNGEPLAVSDTKYSKLITVLSTKYGASSNNTYNVSFRNLPDFRGRFLRGSSYGDVTRDPDNMNRTASNPGGSTEYENGSLQGDEYKSHNHSGSTEGSTIIGNVETSATGTGDGGMMRKWISGGSYVSGLPLKNGIENAIHTHGIDAEGGNETRPKNVYVNYIIRYK